MYAIRSYYGIDAGGKIILDDGYNGNIDGMLEGIRLCSLHEGRKVIVTPGLVEATPELNRITSYNVCYTKLLRHCARGVAS